MSAKIEVVTKEPVILGEGPHWDTKGQALFYVDISGGDVHRYDPQTKVDDKFHVGDYATFVIPRTENNDQLVIGHDLSIEILTWSNKNLKTLATVDKDKPANSTRLNDAKCDAVGRLWAGTMYRTKDPHNMKLNEGSLYSLDAKHNLMRRVPDVSISNGTAWSHDNSLMYYIDSIPHTVDAFDYDLATGNIKNRRTVIDFKNLGDDFGFPDGMTIDNNGKLWIACYSASRVIQCDPETGKLLQTVKLPASKITSCCFGGPNFSDMYVTSIREMLTEEELKGEPLAGHVFKVTGLNAAGNAHYTFSG